MKDVQSYDGDLEMYRETEHVINVAQLRFLRWLADRGRLEHPPSGPPCGAFADDDALAGGASPFGCRQSGAFPGDSMQTGPSSCFGGGFGSGGGGFGFGGTAAPGAVNGSHSSWLQGFGSGAGSGPGRSGLRTQAVLYSPPQRSVCIPALPGP